MTHEIHTNIIHSSKRDESELHRERERRRIQNYRLQGFGGDRESEGEPATIHRPTARSRARAMRESEREMRRGDVFGREMRETQKLRQRFQIGISLPALFIFGQVGSPQVAFIKPKTRLKKENFPQWDPNLPESFHRIPPLCCFFSWAGSCHWSGRTSVQP